MSTVGSGHWEIHHGPCEIHLITMNQTYTKECLHLQSLMQRVL